MKLVIIALCAALLAACSSATGAPSASTPSASTPAGASDPAPRPAATPSGRGSTAAAPSASAGRVDATPAAGQLAGDDVSVEVVAEGLDAPMDVVEAPASLGGGPGALLVALRAGRVVLVGADGRDLGVVLDISERVSTGGERGLLSIAVSPDQRWLYTHHSDPRGDTTITAFDLRGGLDADGGRVLLTVEQPYSNHNGGHLEVDAAGDLLLGLGDGGASGDPLRSGQDPSTLLGSIVRITPTPTADAPYAIPADNPFVDGGGAPEVWAYGLRNPWRFWVDELGGRLWIGDVGQDAVEEIDAVTLDRAGGANFGWAAMEGDVPFYGGAPADAVAPVHTYRHDVGQSVTGGRIARGPRAGALSGWYVFGDFTSGMVRALDPADPSRVVRLDVSLPTVVDFGVDAEGDLLAVTIDGSIRRLIGR